MEESFFKRKTLGLFVKTNGVLSKRFFAGKGFIVCLHRILPKLRHDAFWGVNGMAVSPEYLDWLIMYVRKEGFDWIGMNEVKSRLRDKNSKPFACMTLDDGWRDNLTYGLPVFEKHEVPFCIYVANCFPNGECLMWTEALTKLVEGAEQVAFTYKEQAFRFSTSTIQDKKEAYHKMRFFVLDADTFDEMNSRIAAIFGNLNSIPISEALRWGEVASLAKHKLCTIGAHTVHHVPLAKFTAVNALEEMKNSKLLIEEQIGQSVLHFAYPYGSRNECSYREFNLAKQAGFDTAVTGRPANLFAKNVLYDMAIPRYAIGEGTNEERLRYIMNGVLHFSMNGFKQIVTD